MIGPLEIVVLLVIVLLVTGAYKKLPQLGRSAGTNARIGGEKARELADRNAPKAKELAEQISAKGGEVGGRVNARVGDRLDPETLGRQAGKGLREARELRDTLKGTSDPPKKPEQKRLEQKTSPAGPAESKRPPAPADVDADAPGPADVDADAPGPAADAARRE